MIEARGLTRRFDGFTAVDHVDLSIARGEVFGLLGPNGAGKTTTVRMLSTLIGASEGEAWVAGFRVGREDGEIRRRIGILTESPGLYERISAEANLRFFARLHSLSPQEEDRQVDKYLSLLGLSEKRKEPAATLSKGMKQKLALANWLILESLGSLLSGRLAERVRRPHRVFVLLQLVPACLLPLAVCGVRTIKSVLELAPGQAVGFPSVLYMSCLLLLPLGLANGAQFSFGTTMYSRLTGKHARAAARAYLCEALVAAAGGLAFTYFLLPHLQSTQIAMVVASLNVLSGLLLLLQFLERRGHRPRGDLPRACCRAGSCSWPCGPFVPPRLPGYTTGRSADSGPALASGTTRTQSTATLWWWKERGSTPSSPTAYPCSPRPCLTSLQWRSWST